MAAFLCVVLIALNCYKVPTMFQYYVDKVQPQNITEAFEAGYPVLEKLLESISEECSMHSYAPGKWTIKAMWQHMTDVERIFAFRALSIARGEKQNLPGFDEDEYALAAMAELRSWNDIKEEFLLNRRSVAMMFASFTGEHLSATGSANNTMRSVNDIGLALIGHCLHHVEIMHERYRNSTE